MLMANFGLLLEHLPSPLEPLNIPWLADKGLRLIVKRDDLLHWPGAPAFGGNKWRKLKYNLLEAKQLGHSHLLTIGGAYSNHLAAVAAAGKALGFRTTGIVRGDQPTQALSPTLAYVTGCGMQLHYCQRGAFRQLRDPVFANDYLQSFEPHYYLPEGGTNGLAMEGCAELAREMLSQTNTGKPLLIAVACGTGGTLAGILKGLEGRAQAMGIATLKGGFLGNEVSKLIQKYTDGIREEIVIAGDYHFGGYARVTPALLSFIREFRSQHGIVLDPVYTGKLFYGLLDLAHKDYFEPGTTLIGIHTGGLQGNAGFPDLFTTLESPR